MTTRMRLLVSEDDAALRQVVWTHGDGDTVSQHDANPEAAKLSGKVSVHVGACLGFYLEGAAGEDLFHHTFDLNQVITGHSVSGLRDG